VASPASVTGGPFQVAAWRPLDGRLDSVVAPTKRLGARCTRREVRTARKHVQNEQRSAARSYSVWEPCSRIATSTANCRCRTPPTTWKLQN